MTEPVTSRRWQTWQLVLLLSAVSLAICLGLLWHLRQVRRELVQDTAAVYAQRYARVLTELRSLYTSEVVSIATRHGLDASHDYDRRQDSIPLPATLTILLGERLSAQSDGGRVALYSPYPFPWRPPASRPIGAFERDAWAALQLQPDQPFTRIESVQGVETLRFAIADRMRDKCLGCHNSHPSSPKKDWKLGDVRGVLEVSMPVSEASLAVRDSLRQTSWLLFAVAAVAITAFATTLVQLRRRADLHLELSRTDELTRLANRRSFEAQLSQEWQRAQRDQSPLALLMVDVDHFKAYNDRYGHPAGDACLQRIAEALRQGCRRPADLVCRYGGEEFVVLLPATPIEGARQTAQQLCNLVRALGLAHAGNEGVGFVTVSIGVACEVPMAAHQFHALLQQADEALYRAKAAGRNRVV